eukprot:CAMPEP_0194043798 /NCGR_PEP_ID=MMETSP0009_2-20130614/15375_1 /TAXON_ID=210454 /ORGANISM="Grammatophora oceanica, Strain CCMP 410" /LENGTH=307 /DNA_ID=CAMNT_0038688135 /DNA_START=1 /DNA_END=924 /DNA_ORIENTATION=+
MGPERRFSKLWSAMSFSSREMSTVGRARADTIETIGRDVEKDAAAYSGAVPVGDPVDADQSENSGTKDGDPKRAFPYKRVICASAVVLLLAVIVAVVASVMTNSNRADSMTVPGTPVGKASQSPSQAPGPSQPPKGPTAAPTGPAPTLSAAPSQTPVTLSPTLPGATNTPSAAPSRATDTPSVSPSLQPSAAPSLVPSVMPSLEPSSGTLTGGPSLFPITCTNSDRIRVFVFVNDNGGRGNRRCSKMSRDFPFYCSQLDQSGDYLAGNGAIPFVWQVCQIECEEWALGDGGVLADFPEYDGCPEPLV